MEGYKISSDCCLGGPVGIGDDIGDDIVVETAVETVVETVFGSVDFGIDSVVEVEVLVCAAEIVVGMAFGAA